jgi:lysophospholipase L1-like esterase
MKRMTMVPFLVAAAMAGSVWAQQLSTTPADRLGEEWWKKRYEQKQALVKQGGWELVFVGDSITHGWEGAGKKLWEENFGAYKVLNLGYSGDRTEHVLWRLDHGELDGYQPKLLILMIGTNNTGHRPPEKESPEDTAAGIKAILDKLAQKSPSTKVLLLAVFPRDEKPDGAKRVRNDKVNALIKGYADGKRVVYLDLGPQLLEADGTLTKEMMPDFLHPKEKGYAIWAQAVLPAVKETLGR